MARSFNGSTQYGWVNSAAITPTPPWSISGWINRTTASGYDVLLAVNELPISEDLADYIGVALNSSGNVSAFTGRHSIEGGGFAEGLSAGTVGLNTWAQIGGVWNSASSRQAVLNGVVGTANTTNLPVTVLNQMTIGVLKRISVISDHLAGRAARIGLWNVALNAGDWAALAARKPPCEVRPTALVGYWEVLGVGSPEPDWSGGGRNMTLVASPAAANHAPVGLWFPQRAAYPVVAAAAPSRVPSGLLLLGVGA